MKKSIDLEEIYSKRFLDCLDPITRNLERYIKNLLDQGGVERIDSVFARAKRLDSFLKKAEKEVDGNPKYIDPLVQIQDQIGVRIVTFYIADVERLRKIVLDYLSPIEEREIIPDSISEFDYEGLHYILFLPKDVFTEDINCLDPPKFFELQIKTLYQHAWAQANHDLAYKPETELSRDQKRKVAFTAAQSWGADHIFNDLFLETK